MLRRSWITCALLLHCAPAAFAAERPVVRDVAVYREGEGARIEIRADRPLTYRTYLMPELAKWVIELPGAASAAGDDQSRKMRTAPLERISVRQKEVNGDLLTRIGLDVRGEVEFSLAADPLDRGRLVVRLIPSRPANRQGPTPPPAAPTTTSPHTPRR